MYVCGITPYDATHLGHAATYVAFDLLNRAWRDAGHDVRYVQNVTDVDDPLLERAEATGEDWAGARRARDRAVPHRHGGAAGAGARARTSAPSSRSRWSCRWSSGCAGARRRLRRSSGDLYFSVTARPRVRRGLAAGRASRCSRSSPSAGETPSGPGKKDPLDCLLWQAERPGEPAWDSKLGRGRPGWHVECSAIALRPPRSRRIDVQGGGSDLVFPHHEMSASEAQVRRAGPPFAKAYVHAGMVGLDGEKMSKSKGNLVLVSRLRERRGRPDGDPARAARPPLPHATGSGTSADARPRPSTARRLAHGRRPRRRAHRPPRRHRGARRPRRRPRRPDRPGAPSTTGPTQRPADGPGWPTEHAAGGRAPCWRPL